MKISTGQAQRSRHVSLGIFAWNEEAVIQRTLESLLAQSLFSRLAMSGLRAEIILVLNGCTDRTAAVARQTFAQLCVETPGNPLSWRVLDIPQQGKLNAWNQFVHSASAPEAEVLFMMDADIQIHLADTLWNMLQTLERDADASVAVDQPCKHLAFTSRKGLRERLSLGSAEMTQAAPAQLCGQLYAIRAKVARSIYFPKDLAACEDGFLKALVCTDILKHEVWPQRIQVAPEAAHTFEAYTSPAAILRNQKRQIIGQTLVHLLIDKHLKTLSEPERQNLSDTLERKDRLDPDWLKRLLISHLREVRFFWRLYPGLLGQSFRKLRPFHGGRKARHYPAALAGSIMALLASWMAYRTLKSGCTHYWPKAPRPGRASLPANSDPRLQSI